ERVDAVVALVGDPLVLRDHLVRPLERVVHQLRDVVELLAPDHDLPVGLEAHVAHQRDERVEDLGDAAAEGGGGQMEHLEALKRLRQLANFLHERAADKMRAIRKALVAYGHRLQQTVTPLDRVPSTGRLLGPPASPGAYCSSSLRYLTSRTPSARNSHSSTVARMMAWPSSCSSADTVALCGPPISSTSC